MELSRYTFSDAYILEELRRTYQASDTQGRILLLQQFYRDDQRAPFEVALLAVEDPDAEVRQWMARHGNYLDYRASRDEHTDRNLEDRLKNDPDPFVRACLWENPTVFHAWSTTDWIDYFRAATHLERLALMRNPEVGKGFAEALIRKIFDYEDQELGIGLEARKELILAFLTNSHALSTSRQLKVSDFIDGWSMVSTRGYFSQLWTLISKWPEGTGNLQSVVYQYLGAPDETKAEIYRTCTVPVWRRCILENCDEDNIQTIELGMQDADDQCRELAYTKFNPHTYLAKTMAQSLLEPSTRSLALQIPALVNEKLQTILQSEDKAALSGLALNRSLPIGYLRNVAGRLDELGDDVGVSWAMQTIEEVQKIQPPEEDESGEAENEPRRGNLLDQRHQRLCFAVSLITIIEHAHNRFETLIEGSEPRFISEDGSKAFDTDIELVEGMGKGSVWLDSAGTVRFSCAIVENNSSLGLVRAHLDIIVREIVDYLKQFPVRDWEITEDPLSAPYQPRLRAVHNRWKLEIKAYIIPRVDHSFDASLDIRAIETIEEVQKTQPPERNKGEKDTLVEEQIARLDEDLLSFFMPPPIRRRTVLGHIWNILSNLLEILVVFAIFSVVRTNFETIVVSGLTFIYFGMQSSSALLARASIENAYSSAFQFARIARLLHDPESSAYEETLKEASETYHKADVLFYITFYLGL